MKMDTTDGKPPALQTEEKIYLERWNIDTAGSIDTSESTEPYPALEIRADSEEALTLEALRKNPMLTPASQNVLHLKRDTFPPKLVGIAIADAKAKLGSDTLTEEAILRELNKMKHPGKFRSKTKSEDNRSEEELYDENQYLQCLINCRKCRKEPNQVVSLACGHLFCEKCAILAKKDRPICPCCGKKTWLKQIKYTKHISPDQYSSCYVTK